MLKFIHREIGGARRAVARRSIVRAGLWFVDIPRTSSTSIKHVLGERFGGEFRKSVERETGTKRKSTSLTTALHPICVMPYDRMCGIHCLPFL